MAIHESAENYLETILILKEKNGQVRSIDIANELNFTKPSVSRAMKLLRSGGYLNMDKGGYITFTDKGVEIAERMYERHTFLSNCLIALGVDEETAVEDACRIEHVISQQTFEKVSEYVKNSERLFQDNIE